MPVGAIIGGISSLIAGNAQAKAQAKAAQQNIELQKEFAQKGIRWKVDDAKAAGIHPLAALGANTIGFSPVSIGDGGAGAFSKAGHDLGRAVDATRTPAERDTAYSQALQDLQLQRGQLENTLLASRIRVLNQAGQPPGMQAVGEKLQDPQRTRTLRTPDGIIITNQLRSDAQAFEDRYGDIVQEGYGLAGFRDEVVMPFLNRQSNEVRDWPFLSWRGVPIIDNPWRRR